MFSQLLFSNTSYFLLVIVIAKNSPTDLLKHLHFNYLPHDICGNASILPTRADSEDELNRVLGGKEASPGQHPWMVALFPSPEYNKMNQPFCGGSIINNRYILTAAHCCLLLQKGASIRAGTLDMSSSNHNVQNIEIDRFWVSKAFNSTAIVDDICTLRLNYPLTFSGTVQPICLPFDKSILNHSLIGMFAEVAGWGKYNDDELARTPSVLLTATIPVVPEVRCQSQRGYYDEEKELCAGGRVKNEIRRACVGDSGGSLVLPVVTGNGTKYYQIGIVSNGVMNCYDDSPSKYVRVTTYLKWILDNIGPPD